MALDELEIEKNKLDLYYRELLQYLNAALIFATTGVLSFLGSLFITKDPLKQVIILAISLAVLFLVALTIFLILHPQLKNTRKKLEKLKSKIKK